MTAPSNAARDGSDSTDGGPLRRFLGVPFRTDTYVNLLYLLLAFPLGVAYFAIVVTGLSAGVGGIVTILGVGFLVVTVIAVAVLGALEAILASGLLGVDAPLPEALRADNPDGLRRADNGVIDALVALFTARTTWTALVLVLAKFVYGLVAFVGLVTAAALTVSFVAAPLLYRDTGTAYVFGTYAIETLPQALGLAVLGVVIGLLSLHLSNALAWIGGRLTAVLLAADRPSNDGEAA